MALSIMTQQRAIVNDALHCHLSPSACRRGALASLCHSPTFVPLFHPLLLRAHPFLIGCCVSTIPLAAVQDHDVILLIIFYTINNGNTLPHVVAPTCFPCRTSLSGYPHPVLVDCCFLSSNDGRLKFMHHFLSIFCARPYITLNKGTNHGPTKPDSTHIAWNHEEPRRHDSAAPLAYPWKRGHHRLVPGGFHLFNGCWCCGWWLWVVRGIL
jgi:hypothetical protein